jgi:TctA family transporter
MPGSGGPEAVHQAASGRRALIDLEAGILVFATLGVYSLSGSTVEVLVMYAIGVMGFFMRRYEFPIAPSCSA